LTDRRGSRKGPIFVCICIAALLASPFPIDGRGDAGKAAASKRPLWTFDAGG
jgi:hypothetical protein